jgi:TP901 family phage tail tape measure protein
MAEPIETAFVDIVPDFRNFSGRVKDGIERSLAASAFTPRFDGSGIDRGLSSTTRNLGTAGQAFNQFGSVAARSTQIAALGAAGVGVGIGLAAVKTAQAAIEFESAFAGVRKTVQATEPVLQQIRSDFIDLSTEIPVTTTELSAIGAAAGQLGIETEGITEFTKTVAELGVTTNLTSEQAADSLARLANITQLPQSQFDNLGSTIVALGNKTASTEAEIVEFGLRISGAGHQIGLTQDQILAFGAALASVGLNAEAGGTAISTTFIRIASSVDAGGKKLAAFAEVAGQSSEDFARSFKTAPAEAVTAFIRGLARIDEEGGSVFATLDRLGLGGIRVRDALLRSAGAGDLLSNSLKIGATEWDKNNALQNEAAQRFETTASQIQLAKNEVGALSVEIGGALLPAVGAGAGAVGGLAGAIRGAVQALKGLGGGEFDVVNADLGELTERLAELEEERQDRASVDFLPTGIGKEAKEIIAQIQAISKSLNDSPAGTEKLINAFRDMGPEVRRVLLDGVITPLEAVQLETTATGRAILKALPKSVFVGLGAAARSGIEESAHAVARSGPLIGAALRSAIEDGSRAATATAAEEGVKIGQTLASKIAEAATAGVKQANSIGEAADESVNKAIAEGDTGGQLAALKKKRAGIAEAIERIEKIENPSEARVEQRRTLRAQLAQTTQQIEGIESGIAADQEAAANTAKQNADRAKTAAEKRDRDFVTGLEIGRGDEERAVIAAEGTKGLKNDQAANTALQDVLRSQIVLVKKRVKDVEIRNQALDVLRDALSRAVADGKQIKTDMAADAVEAAQSRTDDLADRLSTLTEIASLRGDEAAQEKGLRAEIQFWRKVAIGAKAGSKAQRDALLAVEQKRAALRSLLEKEKEGAGGKTLAGFLTENAELFGSIASNIGDVGIDPLSGFDFNKSIVAGSKQLQAAAKARGSTSVTAAISGPTRAADPQIDRLIAALDRNTAATEGNTSTGGNGGTKYAKATGQRAAAMGDFWQARQARVMEQARFDGGGGV